MKMTNKPSIQTIQQSWYKTGGYQNFNHSEKTMWLINQTLGYKFQISDMMKTYRLVFGVKTPPESKIRYLINKSVEKGFGTSNPAPRTHKRGIIAKEYLFRVFLGKEDKNLVINDFKKYRTRVAKAWLLNKRGVTTTTPKKKKTKLSPSQRVQKISKSLNSNVSSLYKYLVSNQLAMPMGKEEDEIGDRIAKALLFQLPHGGGGIILGTPTPLAAPVHPKYPFFIMSNIVAAWALKITTSVQPTMVLGNGVNPTKSDIKLKHWKQIGITHKFNFKPGVVDAFTFPMRVAEVAHQHDPCKAILMTSGHWKGTTGEKTTGLDCRFAEASARLVETYPNLHLLVVTYGVNPGTGYYFGLKYLHQNIVKQL